MAREDAAIGVFVTLKPPTKGMADEVVKTGFYVPPSLPDKKFPKLQILTIREILDGGRPQYPQMGPDATFQPSKLKPLEQTSFLNQ